MFAAYQADQVPCLESLGQRWGEVCVSKEIASEWAERFLPITWKFFDSERTELALFEFTSVCLSSRFVSQRYYELETLVILAVRRNVSRACGVAVSSLDPRGDVVVPWNPGQLDGD